MNSSTHFSGTSRKSKKRQSKITLAFFCLIFLVVLISSCSENIFTTPYGNKTLLIDTLSYDQSVISSIRNLNVDASGNQLYQNKVGNFNDLNAEFITKFTNFVALNSLPDSVEFTINEANVLLFKAHYWGNEDVINLNINMIENDSSLYWTNIDDVAETFTSIENKTSLYQTVAASTSDDYVTIPLDLTLVNNWHTTPDSLYVNNGFTVTTDDTEESMIAFYSSEFSADSELLPRLELNCSLSDTNGIYLQDSIITVYCGGDMQKTSSSSDVDENLFYISQGNIHRAYVSFDSLRQDTLLGPTDLLNQAILTMVIDPLNSIIAERDTVYAYLTARLFKTDYWENDSTAYKYTIYSSVFDQNVDTIKMDISQLLQYMIATPKEMDHEGIFFYLNDEYNDFNILSIDPAQTQLDIVYTKVKDE